MPNKVLRQGFFGWEDHLPVPSAVITTGWLPGQFAQINTTNGVDMALFTNAGNTVPYGVLIDDDNELSAPPSASRVTVVHGYAKLFIQGGGTDATNPWDSSVNSATVNTKLFASSASKWTVLSGSAAPFPEVGSLFQVPTAANSFMLGVLLRI